MGEYRIPVEKQPDLIKELSNAFRLFAEARLKDKLEASWNIGVSDIGLAEKDYKIRVNLSVEAPGGTYNNSRDLVFVSKMPNPSWLRITEFADFDKEIDEFIEESKKGASGVVPPPPPEFKPAPKI